LEANAFLEMRISRTAAKSSAIHHGGEKIDGLYSPLRMAVFVSDLPALPFS
jgi:hypothetical protein